MQARCDLLPSVPQEHRSHRNRTLLVVKTLRTRWALFLTTKPFSPNLFLKIHFVLVGWQFWGRSTRNQTWLRSKFSSSSCMALTQLGSESTCPISLGSKEATNKEWAITASELDMDRVDTWAWRSPMINSCGWSHWTFPCACTFLTKVNKIHRPYVTLRAIKAIIGHKTWLDQDYAEIICLGLHTCLVAHIFLGITAPCCSIDSCWRKRWSLLFWVWDKPEGHHFGHRHLDPRALSFTYTFGTTGASLTRLLWIGHCNAP